jgi:hypothetical protein
MSTQKLLRNILGNLPKGTYAEQGRSHIRINLPNGRFVVAGTSPRDEDTACRNVVKQARRELQR